MAEDLVKVKMVNKTRDVGRSKMFAINMDHAVIPSVLQSDMMAAPDGRKLFSRTDHSVGRKKGTWKERRINAPWASNLQRANRGERGIHLLRIDSLDAPPAAQ